MLERLDRSGHSVIVPREYLERLEEVYEKFSQSNQHKYNAQVLEVGDRAPIALLRCDTFPRYANDIIIVDDKGREVCRYKKAE